MVISLIWSFEKEDEQPVDDSTKHAGVVLSKVGRATFLVLLLDGGAVVLGQVLGEHLTVGMDYAPKNTT